MFTFYLPLANQFAKVLSEYEIHEWEAKSFWVKFDHSKMHNPAQLRQYMYSGLRVLSKNGFLSVKYSESNSRVYLYTETSKLKMLRCKILDKDYGKLLIEEKYKLNKELDEICLHDNFIYELILKYPQLNLRLSKMKDENEFKKHSCEMKIQFLDNLIKSF